MTPRLWLLILLSQGTLVASQLLMKRAMVRREHRATWIGGMIAGTALVFLWLLLWLGAMPRLEVSKLVPFEGMSPLLIVLGAAIFLGERLPARAWAGLILTCLGIALVAAS